MNWLSTLVLTMVTVATVFAQSDEHWVKLYDGRQMNGQRLLYERPILKSPYFNLDGFQLETTEVEFFQNNHGVFANLYKLSPGKERFALRLKKGKVSIFEEVEIAIYGADELELDVGAEVRTKPILATGENMDYYRVEEGPIRKANYKNFKSDFSANEESLNHLRLYNRYRTLQWGTLGLGIVAAIGGLFLNDNNRAEFSPISALGIGVAGASYFYEYPKRDELWFAVEAYNR